jgi:hypothetical protein
VPDKQSAVTEPDSQNAGIEIPDANFKAYVLENFDTDKDGILSKAEADLIKAISCPDLEIASIEGVEKFSNLESLDCSNNKLVELELRYNKKLNKLICIGNEATLDDDGTITPLTLYIGMSSPLRNPYVQKPKNNVQPGVNGPTPVDVSKCTIDKTTRILLSFDD